MKHSKETILLAVLAFLFLFVRQLRMAFQKKSISNTARLNLLFAMLREVFYFNSPQKKKKQTP